MCTSHVCGTLLISPPHNTVIDSILISPDSCVNEIELLLGWFLLRQALISGQVGALSWMWGSWTTEQASLLFQTFGCGSFQVLSRPTYSVSTYLHYLHWHYVMNSGNVSIYEDMKSAECFHSGTQDLGLWSYIRHGQWKRLCSVSLDQYLSPEIICCWKVLFLLYVLSECAAFPHIIISSQFRWFILQNHLSILFGVHLLDTLM